MSSKVRVEFHRFFQLSDHDQSRLEALSTFTVTILATNTPFPILIVKRVLSEDGYQGSRYVLSYLMYPHPSILYHFTGPVGYRYVCLSFPP